jgi:hypothetical protein
MAAMTGGGDQALGTTRDPEAGTSRDGTVTTRDPDGMTPTIMAGITAELSERQEAPPANGGGCFLICLYSQRRIDLVAECEAAGVRVRLRGVEAIRDVCVADSVFQVDESE